MHRRVDRLSVGLLDVRTSVDRVGGLFPFLTVVGELL
jgi:hypothetical protein